MGMARVKELLKGCCLCARRCGLDRTQGELGPCGAGMLSRVARWLAHMGEEPPISGTHGSGTIFFSGCSLHCVFCQNFDISHLHRHGAEVSSGRLAEIMRELEEAGCHNINLVSPTHYVPQIAEAVELAREQGLELPVVYNTHGYDSAESLAIMDGKADIYLADMKYACNETAWRLSGARGYREANRSAVEEMFAQVGHLIEEPGTGVAVKGLLVRILVLPGQQEGAKELLLL